MQQTNSANYFPDSSKWREQNRRVDFTERIISMMNRFPNLIEDYALLIPNIKSGMRRIRYGKETVGTVLDVQDDFEKIFRKEDTNNWSEDDVRTLMQRLAQVQTFDWEELSRTNFEFDGQLMPRFAADWVNVHGKYDTGSDTNWISLAILTTAGYNCEDDIRPHDGPQFKSIDGNAIAPLGKIRIAWRQNGRKRQTVFLVLADLHFDIVIGKGLVEQYAALATRHLPKGTQAIITDKAKDVKADVKGQMWNKFRGSAGPTPVGARETLSRIPSRQPSAVPLLAVPAGMTLTPPTSPRPSNSSTNLAIPTVPIRSASRSPSSESGQRPSCPPVPKPKPRQLQAQSSGSYSRSR